MEKKVLLVQRAHLALTPSKKMANKEILEHREYQESLVDEEIMEKSVKLVRLAKQVYLEKKVRDNIQILKIPNFSIHR